MDDFPQKKAANPCELPTEESLQALDVVRLSKQPPALSEAQENNGGDIVIPKKGSWQNPTEILMIYFFDLKKVDTMWKL